MTLCYLVLFFDLYHKDDFTRALKTLLQTNLLPMKTTQLDKFMAEFKSMDSTIRHNFAQITLAAMVCIHQAYEDEKRRRLINQESNWSSSPDNAMAGLKEFAKTVVTYAGLNQFHMPGDTYAQLVRLEVQMT
eukprot:TRINITY_DN4354_c0_g1_i8.p2 TRINITY_DN4354_c0_g1~~TRINITY_DN4354_c0_g1_i8.p2  ORF type:complete len:132 (+),score=32.27 TRINITY_DN4354_c0_g1_i8:654-1049(+)